MKAEYKPLYPIYIISKGRAESRYTHKALLKMKQPHYVAIEPHEYSDYAAVIPEEYLLVLPFSNHGQGSTLARNWCWQHAKRRGFKRHWLLDDNITYFMRRVNTLRIQVYTPAFFRVMEDFTDRYANVPLAGPQYSMFATNIQRLPPFIYFSRVFSCCLIDTSFEYSWHGKYNEDVILSLNVLKHGYCTLSFYAFLQNKLGTQTIKGGNTTELYGNGTKEKSDFLINLFPDDVEPLFRYGRDHHFINYAKFKTNKLIPVDANKRFTGENEYGMILSKEKEDGSYETYDEVTVDMFRPERS